MIEGVRAIPAGFRKTALHVFLQSLPAARRVRGNGFKRLISVIPEKSPGRIIDGSEARRPPPTQIDDHTPVVEVAVVVAHERIKSEQSDEIPNQSIRVLWKSVFERLSDDLEGEDGMSLFRLLDLFHEGLVLKEACEDFGAVDELFVGVLQKIAAQEAE